MGELWSVKTNFEHSIAMNVCGVFQRGFRRDINMAAKQACFAGATKAMQIVPSAGNFLSRGRGESGIQ